MFQSESNKHPMAGQGYAGLMVSMLESLLP